MSEAQPNSDGHLCQSRKKIFKSREAAEQFEKDLSTRYPNQARQHAYACESCPNWHLSATPKDAYGLARSPNTNDLLRNANARPATSGNSAGGRPKGGFNRTNAEKLEAFKLRDAGWSFTQIAEKFDVASQTIGNWLASAELQRKYAASKVPVTLEQIETEEQRLERQLAELRAKKAAAIEAKRWKFLPCWEGKGVLLKKDGNQMGVLVDDAEELVILLGDYLNQSAAKKAEAAAGK